MDCSVEHGGSPACLVIGNPASLVLLDLETGTFLLSQAYQGDGPVLGERDAQKGSESTTALASQEESPVRLCLLP